jgi:hypothetical protein
MSRPKKSLQLRAVNTVFTLQCVLVLKIVYIPNVINPITGLQYLAIILSGLYT